MQTTQVVENQITQENTSSETFANIHLSKALLFGKEAIQADNDGKHREAFNLYMQSVEFFIKVMGKENNPARKQLLKKKVLEFVSRAETLKKEFNKQELEQQKLEQELNKQESKQELNKQKLEQELNKQKLEQELNKQELKQELSLDPTTSFKDINSSTANPQIQSTGTLPRTNKPGPPLPPRSEIQVEPQQPEVQDVFQKCQVLFSVENVDCFSIIGKTKKLIERGTLQILKPQSDISSEKDFSFLKVGSFRFPLTPQVPCLRSSDRNYIVPMPSDMFYGFIFPQQMPPQYLLVFEKYLSKLCDFKSAPQLEKERSEGPPLPVRDYRPPSQASTLSGSQRNAPPLPQKDIPAKLNSVQGPPLPLRDYTPSPTLVPQNSPYVKETTVPILASSQRDEQGIAVSTLTYIAGGLNVLSEKISIGSEYLGTGIRSTGEMVKSRVDSNPSPAKISPVVTNTVNVASTVSPYAVKVSSTVIDGLVTVAQMIGSGISDGLKSAFPSDPNSPPSETTKALKETGSSIINVWDSLETAGRSLLREGRDTTVGFVDHKWGPEAADVTSKGIQITGDIAETAYNIDQIGIKKLAKQGITETGKATVKGLAKSE